MHADDPRRCEEAHGIRATGIATAAHHQSLWPGGPPTVSATAGSPATAVARRWHHL